MGRHASTAETTDVAPERTLSRVAARRGRHTRGVSVGLLVSSVTGGVASAASRAAAGAAGAVRGTRRAARRRTSVFASGAVLLGGVVVGGAAMSGGVDAAQAAQSVPGLAPLAATATPEPRTVTVTVDGATHELSTEAATLAAALAEAGIVVDADDVVSAPLADPVPLEPVTIERVATTLAVTQETEAFASSEVPDPNRLEGDRTVVTPGVAGVTQIVADVTTRDGVEVGRQEVARVQLTARVDEVVSVGTMKQADVATPTGARAIAARMVAERGWGQDQYQCLDRLWEKESNWRWNADNPTSSAYGIPQALPGSKMSSAGADWATNPATQITWGLGYIADRYGTPCAAWGHSQARNWY